MLERGAAKTCTFRAVMSAGVWQVTRDDVFYGDYLTRGDALASACSAARSFEAVGGRAQVVACPGEAIIPHQGRRGRS